MRESWGWLVALSLASCAQSAPVEPVRPTPPRVADTVEPKPPPSQSATAEPEAPAIVAEAASFGQPAPPAAERGPFNGDTGTEGQVILRLELEGGLTVELSCSPFASRGVGAHLPFGHVPPFTLYADGSLIVSQGPRHDARILRAQLSKGEVDALMSEVEQLGIERIQSHTSNCSPGPERSCVADANTVVLTVRTKAGQRRVTRNYAGFAKDKAALDAVVKRLRDFDHPDLRAYQPSHATMIVEACTFDSQHSEQPTGQFRVWPLAQDLLRPPSPQAKAWARTVLGDAFEHLYRGELRHGWTLPYELDGKHFVVYLVPLLPGADTRAIDAYRR